MALKWVKTIEAGDEWWDLQDHDPDSPYYAQGYVVGYKDDDDRWVVTHDFPCIDTGNNLSDTEIPKTEIRTWRQLRKALVAKYLLLRDPEGWS